LAALSQPVYTPPPPDGATRLLKVTRHGTALGFGGTTVDAAIGREVLRVVQPAYRRQSEAGGLQTRALVPRPDPRSQNPSLATLGRILYTLDDPDHFLENQSRQRRRAPILIGIHGNTDRLHSGTQIDITEIRIGDRVKETRGVQTER
jgi:hypothetical protein